MFVKTPQVMTINVLRLLIATTIVVAVFTLILMRSLSLLALWYEVQNRRDHAAQHKPYHG
jgi:hypothetical protein